MFEGTWIVEDCTEPEPMKEVLKDARWEIRRDANDHYQVTLRSPAAGTMTCTAECEKDCLRGRYGEAYYFEVVAVRPPAGLKTKPYLYGVLCPIDANSGGDLGDPGTWKAEDSGNPPGQE